MHTHPTLSGLTRGLVLHAHAPAPDDAMRHQCSSSGRVAYGVSGVRASTILSLRALAPSRGARQHPGHARQSAHFEALVPREGQLPQERCASVSMRSDLGTLGRKVAG